MSLNTHIMYRLHNLTKNLTKNSIKLKAVVGLKKDQCSPTILGPFSSTALQPPICNINGSIRNNNGYIALHAISNGYNNQ